MGDVELGLDTLNIFLLLFFGKKISSEREEEERVVVQREKARAREEEPSLGEAAGANGAPQTSQVSAPRKPCNISSIARSAAARQLELESFR